MLKLVLFLLAGYIVFRLLRPAKRSNDNVARETIERMVTCAQCGINFPEREAVMGDDRVFCSEPHRDAWKHDH